MGRRSTFEHRDSRVDLRMALSSDIPRRLHGAVCRTDRHDGPASYGRRFQTHTVVTGSAPDVPVANGDVWPQRRDWLDTSLGEANGLLRQVVFLDKDSVDVSCRCEFDRVSPRDV